LAAFAEAKFVRPQSRPVGNHLRSLQHCSSQVRVSSKEATQKASVTPSDITKV
jgi:hypothetical protein